MKQDTKNKREFLFVRHGQTDWNIQGRLQGRSDQPLNSTGIAQARVSAESLVGQSVGAIVSSPLLRAHQTATIISDRLGVPVMTDDDLIERNFGAFEGQLLSEIVPAGISVLDFVTMEGLSADSEPWGDVCQRVSASVDNWQNDFRDKPVLFVSHYGVISALCQNLFGEKKPAKNAVPYHFSRSGEWSMTEVMAKD